jgi:hypothetical protein
MLMVVLVGHRGINGGVYWQLTLPDDPDELTMMFPEQVATDAAVPDVSLPEVVGQEAWTIDFDAVRAHLGSQSFSHLPPWASGQARTVPSEVGPPVRFDITPEMVGGVGVGDVALGMLRHMRKQVLGHPAPYVEVRPAAISVGVDPGGSECRALVDELLRAGYIRRYPSPSLTEHGLYRLTDRGIAAAAAER